MRMNLYTRKHRAMCLGFFLEKRKNSYTTVTRNMENLWQADI